VITYEPLLVMASFVIAITASFAALWLAFRLRNGQSGLMLLARAAAAVVMGFAITGMHYTAMAASMLAPGSYCWGGAAFDNGWLALTIGLIALALLAITLITAVYDAHLDSRTRRDAQRLATLNADLQHGKNLLTLATKAAGIACWEYEVATRTALWTENDIEALRVEGIDLHKDADALISMIRLEDATAALATIRAALAEGRNVCAMRVRVTTPAGRTVHLQVHARLFRDSHGQLDRLLGVAWDVSEQVCQEERRLELQLQLREVSRHAGMAEVATGVLHSVGNLLNSLGVSTTLVLSGLRDSRVVNVSRVAQLLVENSNGPGGFLETDPRGREIPAYLAQLGEHLGTENRNLYSEMQTVASHVEHIGKIVAAQQTYARRGGVTEEVELAELVDNAIALNFGGVSDIRVQRDYQLAPRLTLDRHKLIQILGNLLSNARHALRDLTQGKRVLTVRLRQLEQSLAIEVEDTGVGIEAEVLKRLFAFGFTTKKDGHGFGLHASANLAKDLGGEITVHSDGPGQGARFTLCLPLHSGMGIAERKLA
jgi:signal transduction histidine kinase